MMTAPHETMIDTPAGRLHVSVQGEGPPAIFWHSLLVDSRQWSRVEGELATERTVVLVDGPGHGRSGPPPASAGFTECADAAVAVLDELKLDRADWVGNAWGGHCGYVFAARHPERCRTLTAVAAPVTPLPPAQRRRIRLLVAAYGLVGSAPLRKPVIETLLSPATRACDAAAVDLVTDAFLAGDRIGMHRVMHSMMLRRADLTHLLADITMPALIVSGSDDPTFSPTRASSLAEALPRGSAVTIESAGHLPPLERPADFILALRRLWDNAL